MQRIINSELLDYLHQRGLISKCQYGFLSKQSTSTNLLDSVYDETVAVNNKLTTDIMYRLYRFPESIRFSLSSKIIDQVARLWHKWEFIRMDKSISF